MGGTACSWRRTTPRPWPRRSCRIDRDPELAERLSRAAQATVRERFDGDRLTGRLIELFRPVPG